jgi:hypothetical protein
MVARADRIDLKPRVGPDQAFELAVVGFEAVVIGHNFW